MQARLQEVETALSDYHLQKAEIQQRLDAALQSVKDLSRKFAGLLPQ
jgi:hypothetical protein